MNSEIQTKVHEASVQSTLDEVNIPYDPDVFKGMAPEVGNDLVDIVTMPQAALLLFASDGVALKNQALAATDNNLNDSIAEFVSYEPFAQIGTVVHALAIRNSRNQPATPEEDEEFKMLSTRRIGNARKAIEATIAYHEGNSPTELWNYFEQILNELEKEFMEVVPTNSGFAAEIQGEITEYKTLQEKLKF